MPDIIVTAQRRDESLSRTPVAVAVVSSEALAKAQVKTENDLRFATPGLAVRAGLADTQLNFSLRGQSQDPFSDTRPGVLPYFNEFPLSGQGISTALYDLQSVQVLKGPQGMLFGRSATGGAVLYTTVKPTHEFGGVASVSYGNFNALRLEGAVNAPVVKDVLAVRVAGFYMEKNGFQHNLFNNQRIGDRKREGARASILFTPTEGVRNTLVYDYFHASGQNSAVVIGGLIPFTGSGSPYFPSAALYSGTATPTATLTGQCTLQALARGPACPPPLPNIAAAYNAYFSTRSNLGLQGIYDQQVANGPRTVNQNDENIFRARVHTVVNTTEIDIGDNATLKNVFGFQRSISTLSIDVDGTPYAIQDYVAPQTNNSRQYSDELQLSGKAFNENLTYVIGGFYSDEKLKYTARIQFFDLLFGGQTLGFDHDLLSKTRAGYAQGTYKLNDDGLSVTGGVRYTSEKVGVVILPADRRSVFCGVAGYSCNQSHTYNKLSWTFGLQDQVNPNLLIYAVTRRSYKSGGFNAFDAPLIGTAEQGGNAFRAERATDVEAGLKYNGTMSGVPFRTNIAVYHAWTHNSQRAAYVFLNGSPGALNVNVPEQKTYGLELDAQVKPAPWLDLGGTFNYTKSRFTDGNALILEDNVTGGRALTTQPYNQVPDTPKTSGTVFADITIPVSGPIKILAHGDVYFQSRTVTSPRVSNNVGTRIAGYSLVNFRLGLEDEESGWSLTANLKNAFDKGYYLGGFAIGEQYQFNTIVPAEPRTFTVEARIKF